MCVSLCLCLCVWQRESWLQHVGPVKAVYLYIPISQIKHVGLHSLFSKNENLYLHTLDSKLKQLPLMGTMEETWWMFYPIWLAEACGPQLAILLRTMYKEKIWCFWIRAGALTCSVQSSQHSLSLCLSPLSLSLSPQTSPDVIWLLFALIFQQLSQLEGQDSLHALITIHPCKHCCIYWCLVVVLG